MNEAALARVDHLVYATRDLERSVDALERLLGVRAAHGGAHPGRGTRNALLALGQLSYLEIIGPDPEQERHEGKRWLGVDDVVEARLVTWAAKSSDLAVVSAIAKQDGFTLGPIRAGRRTRTDGVELAWQLTDAQELVADGVVPFFIDWGNSPHPAGSAPHGLALRGLRAEHPDADRISAVCDALDVPIEVTIGKVPALIAMIESPNGVIELR